MLLGCWGGVAAGEARRWAGWEKSLERNGNAEAEAELGRYVGGVTNSELFRYK